MEKPQVKGYRQLTPEMIALMNEFKELEAQVLAKIKELQANPEFDQRWIATGRTDIQKGFMCTIRGITRPEE